MSKYTQDPHVPPRPREGGVEDRVGGAGHRARHHARVST